MLEVPIQLSPNEKYLHNFIITNSNSFPGALLLGSDFFNRVGARILYDEKILRIGKASFPLIKSKPLTTPLSFHVRKIVNKYPSNSIYTDSILTIPHESSINFEVESPKFFHENKTYMIENSLEEVFPLRLAHCFTKTNKNKISLALLNRTNEDITIPSNTWVVIATPVDIHNYRA
jgi:hypothetical protein